MTRVNDLGEKKLIERLASLVDIETADILARHDDVFYLKSPGNSNLVLHADMLVGRTDVPPGMEHYYIGRKAVIQNVSDFIVKGVVPTGMIVSLALPGHMYIEQFDALMKGIGDTAKQYNIKYLGGDINEADDLIIDITLVGFHDDVIVPRKGIKPGQVIATTGVFGFTSAGLHLTLNGLASNRMDKYRPVLDAVLKPCLNYEAILGIARQPGIVASIDSSDGLSACLFDLMDVNDYGFLIDTLPVESIINEFAFEYGLSLDDLLFNGGEEFHAIFVIESKRWDKVHDFARQRGYYLEKIGVVIDEKKIQYQGSGSYKRREIRKPGFEHLSQHDHGGSS
nr:thiamine-phosphate kinase [Candidatus Sigynarchaeum springense]MDO8119286.1 thiamine-phosphate kinase [Candidatus Sigynarchaeota archaeon]